MQIGELCRLSARTLQYLDRGGTSKGNIRDSKQGRRKTHNRRLPRTGKKRRQVFVSGTILNLPNPAQKTTAKAEHNLKSNYLKALESKEKLVESARLLGEGETGSYARKFPSLWLVDKN